jgi:hypothetical protein
VRAGTTLADGLLGGPFAQEDPMSRTARAIGVSAAFLFSLHMVSLHGEQKSGKPAPAPHTAKTTTAKPQSPKPMTGKPAAGKHGTTKQQAPKAATAPKGTKATPKSAKLTAQKTKPAPKAAETSKKDDGSLKTASRTKKANAARSKKDASAKADSTKKKTNATDTATATPATPALENLNPVQQKLAKNTNLQSKLQSRLPAGTNMMEAADGFRNLGQFVAAVNVSKNLDIPFDKLKADMVTKKMSLGQSIQDLRPSTSSATVEAQHAEYDANTMIVQTEQETSVTASAKTTSKTTTTTTAAAKPRKSGHKTLTGGA